MKKQLTLLFAALCFLCNAAIAQLPAYLPADGLVAWYPFNGNANDESGNGNDGVVNGATLTEDRFGLASNAYSFDGIANCIDVQHSSSLSIFGSQSASSISLWCYTELNQPADLINKGFHSDVASFGNKYLSLTNDAVGYQYTLYDFSTLNSVRPPDGYLNTQQWYHVLIVRDASIKVYVNGMDATTSANDAGWSSNYNLVLDDTNMSFGCRNNKDINNVPFQNLFYAGKIDDIAIYNRALTEQEIQNLYTGAAPAACLDLPANLQEGLVGYWPFCGNANDESGNNIDFEINGPTLTADRFGNSANAYQFEGLPESADYLATTQISNFVSSEYTFTLWFNSDQFNPYQEPSTPYDFVHFNTQSLITTNSNDWTIGSAISSGLWYDNSKIYCEHWPTTSSVMSGARSNSILEANTWYNLIVSYSNGVGTVYLNSSVLFSFNSSLDFSNQLDLIIGGKRNGPDMIPMVGFHGVIDDVAWWNRALTPEEVTQLYAVQSTGDPTAGGGNGNTSGPLANVPRGISYQAVARDAQGQAIVSAPVNVRFTLHESTPSGTAEYSETHALTTNEIGLFHTYFGSGVATTSAFDSIVWSNTTKFLQVEIDLGSGYVDMGTQQLMSVPYAYRANEAAAAGTIRNNALPIFADNTAALAGGLVAGEMYRTAAGDLKIVY